MIFGIKTRDGVSGTQAKLASLPPFTREGHQTELAAEGQVEALSRGDDRDRNGRASRHLHSARDHRGRRGPGGHRVPAV